MEGRLSFLIRIKRAMTVGFEPFWDAENREVIDFANRQNRSTDRAAYRLHVYYTWTLVRGCRRRRPAIGPDVWRAPRQSDRRSPPLRVFVNCLTHVRVSASLGFGYNREPCQHPRTLERS